MRERAEVNANRVYLGPAAGVVRVTMDRRRFLSLASGAPLVWGLDRLLAREPSRAPDWLGAARRRMADTGRPGVILAVPERRPDRFQMGSALHELLKDPDEGVHEIFSGAVFVCLDSELAVSAGFGHFEEGNRVLVSPGGDRVLADDYDLDLLEDPPSFVESFGPFLHGEDGSRLREFAGAVRARASAGALAAIDVLESDSVEERERAACVLARHLDSILPLVLQLRRTAAGQETRSRMATLVEQYWARHDASEPGSRLPFGCTRPREPLAAQRGCGACGIAIVTGPTRKFLGFLTK